MVRERKLLEQREEDRWYRGERCGERRSWRSVKENIIEAVRTREDSCDCGSAPHFLFQPLLPHVSLETGHYDTTRLSSLLCAPGF